MINEALSSLATLIERYALLAPLFAFLAGMITSVLPCSLSSLPLIITYTAGRERSMKNTFMTALFYALGSALVFIALALAASFLSIMIGKERPLWYFFLGMLMILMALQISELFTFIPSSHLVSKNRKKGYAGAFISGMLSSLFSSPCSTPVLVALLSLSSVKADYMFSFILLLFYSLGYGILSICASLSVSWIKKVARNSKYIVISWILKIALSLSILALGLYFIYLAL